MTQPENQQKSRSSRRDFLRSSTLGAVGGVVATQLSLAPHVHPAGSDRVKIGLIGCGSRGTGAVRDALRAAPNVKLVAMGDVFRDRLDSSLKALLKEQPNGVEVPEERCHVGFDAYQKVIAGDVDSVILATPPGFRPEHLRAAVAAGKHVFAEKPVAVDGPGVRTCLEVFAQAEAKGVNIVAGTVRRRMTGYLETMKRVHDGAIGRILAARCYWNTGGLWVKRRQPEWTDMEWQLRNWLYFTWLSGDHIVEQHVHNLDAVNWAMAAHPVRAVGMGGRQVRTDPAYGHIYDHFAIDYEYESGCHLMSMCRQIDGCEKNVSEALIGDKGSCHLDILGVNRYRITGANRWRLRGKENNAYVQEHADLIESIRSGRKINELKDMAESTLTAIMGRMSAYTGQAITWEQALNSTEKLGPAKPQWGDLPVPPVAIPERTELV